MTHRSGGRFLFVPLTLSLFVAACGAAHPSEPYVGLSATKEAAAQAVIDGIAARDDDRLMSLAVTEVEFRKNIYPELPASAPDVGMSVDYLWADTSMKSRGYLAQTVSEHGGLAVTVESVRFGGRPTEYDGFTIHPDTYVTVRDPAGTMRELRLFGSMIETPAGWKVYSYIVD